MMTVFQPGQEQPVAECSLKPQKGGYLVVRLVDDAGRYRRVKFPVVERGGIKGIEAEDMAVAALLPDFRLLHTPMTVDIPKVDKPREKGKLKLALGKTARATSEVGHEERRGRIAPNLARSDNSVLDLKAQVLIRILRKLHSISLVLAEELTLPAATLVHHPLTLGELPEGHLLFQPAPAIPLALPLVLQRADLGLSGNPVFLPLQAAEVTQLAAGTLLGILEVRSPSELPEGMRQKVFQSHFESSLAEAMSCASP